jgi:signal transduction histidine kinase/HD-like signal output (HDOD) protein
MENGSLKLLEKIDTTRLPPLPQALLRLVDICDDPKAGLPEIGGVIASDGALASRVMGVAGSAAYRTTARISTLDRALALIGTDMAKALAISAAIHQAFSGLAPREVDQKRFWRHSLLCAQTSRRLAEILNEPYPGEAYLGGLIHDVGQLLLAMNFPKEYAPVLESGLHGSDLCELERSTVQVSHDVLGEWLVTSWRLEPFLADAVAFHHEPMARLPGSHPLVQIVHLANRLSQDDVPAGPGLDNALALSPKTLLDLRAKAATEVLQIARSLGIEIESEGGKAASTPPAEQASMERLRCRPALVQEGTPETFLERRRFRGRATDPSPAEPDPADPEHRRLIERVEAFALLSGVRPRLANVQGTAGAETAVRQCLNLLFGAQYVDFYLFDEAAGMLRNTIATPEGEAILSIPVGTAASTIVRAWQTQALLVAFRGKTQSVVDRQACRLLESMGLLCMPLSTAEKRLGTMAVGGSLEYIRRLANQRSLLMLFAHEAANALMASIPRREPPADDARMLLARKVVHEVNSPLAIIKNYLAALGAKLPQSSPAQHDLHIIDQEIDRVSGIVHRLVNTEGSQAEGVANIKTLFAEILRLVAPTLLEPAGIETRTRFVGVPTVRTDVQKLRQALLNLIRNAAEAMPKGGTLTLSFREPVIADGRRFVQIAVEDTGPGLPEEVLLNLFEPIGGPKEPEGWGTQAPGLLKLFKPVRSSKGAGHAGLGLSIVGSLVEELGGSIHCGTGPEGTSFHILLPRESPEPKPQIAN